jgi:streptomycin 6-kinase
VRGLPERLPRKIREYFGAAGQLWLDNLPERIACAADRWRLDLGEPSPAAGTGFVCPARDAAGRDVVLKVAFPDEEHVAGVEALRIWAGRGCVRLLATAEGDTELLMERLLPGTHLFEVEDEEQEIAVTAGIMGQLHRRPPETHGLPDFRAWTDKALRRRAARADVGDDLFPERLIEALQQTMDDLEALDRPAVLHGDLHHENILFDGDRGWLAIDPKGIIGDPLLELGRYCSNQLQRAPGPHAVNRLLDRRIAAFARELGEPEDRVRAGAAAEVIMCMGWELERDALDIDDLTQRRDRALHLTS